MPDRDLPPAERERQNLLRRFVDWMREGYPTGMTDTDANALLFVLKHHLTPADVNRVVKVIIENTVGDPSRLSKEDIAYWVEHTMQQKPSPEDIAKVEAALGISK